MKYIKKIIKIYKKNIFLNSIFFLLTWKIWKFLCLIHLFFFILGIFNLFIKKDLNTKNPIDYSSFKILKNYKNFKKKKKIIEKIDIILYYIFAWFFIIIFKVSLKSIEIFLNYINYFKIKRFKENNNILKITKNFIIKEYTKQEIEKETIKVFKKEFYINPDILDE